MTFETDAIHAGYNSSPNQHAASVPIYATAAFNMESALRGDGLAPGEEEGFSYSRVANPTVDILEKRLAQLEGGIGAVAVSSGMAAVSYALLCVAEQGGRIISSTNLYGASIDAMETFFPNFGICTDFVNNINNLGEVESLITPDTRAIFAESVANPSTELTDIEGLSSLAHRHGIPLIVDNTVPTPYLFRPIEFGADIVVHSTTKGITGHGNAIGGIVIDAGRFDWANGRFPQFTQNELVISDERQGRWESFCSAFGQNAFIQRVRTKYLHTLGAVQSPFNAYLQLVGLETLPQRIRQEVSSATTIATHLQQLPHVANVFYSGIDKGPQSILREKYFPHGVGTILSFVVDGTEENVMKILDSVKTFTYIPNIGDAKSLIVNPARITHREVPAEYRNIAGISDNLIRLSIGLEDVNDLIADIDQAIASAY